MTSNKENLKVDTLIVTLYYCLFCNGRRSKDFLNVNVSNVTKAF